MPLPGIYSSSTFPTYLSCLRRCVHRSTMPRSGCLSTAPLALEDIAKQCCGAIRCEGCMPKSWLCLSARMPAV